MLLLVAPSVNPMLSAEPPTKPEKARQVMGFVFTDSRLPIGRPTELLPSLPNFDLCISCEALRDGDLPGGPLPAGGGFPLPAGGGFPGGAPLPGPLPAGVVAFDGGWAFPATAALPGGAWGALPEPLPSEPALPLGSPFPEGAAFPPGGPSPGGASSGGRVLSEGAGPLDCAPPTSGGASSAGRCASSSTGAGVAAGSSLLPPAAGAWRAAADGDRTDACAADPAARSCAGAGTLQCDARPALALLLRAAPI